VVNLPTSGVHLNPDFPAFIDPVDVQAYLSPCDQFPVDPSNRAIDWCAVVLGHELGHALEGREDEVRPGGDNVNEVENILRADFGLPLRDCYHGYPLPPYGLTSPWLTESPPADFPFPNPPYRPRGNE
jgi:hypothetical protein